MGLPVIGLAVRGVTNGIGLAHEALDARKKNKLAKAASNTSAEAGTSSSTQAGTSTAAAAAQQDAPPPSYESVADGQHLAMPKKSTSKESYHSDVDSDSSDSDAEDEEAWALDDAGIALGEDKAKKEQPKKKLGYDAQESIESLATRIIAHCPPPPTPLPRLEQPVILPERRPGNRQRGFVHAYAPILAGNGIDEQTFLSFLEIFGAATHSSPVLKVVQLGATAAGFVPEPTAQITSTVVSIAVGAAQELQRRQRTNNFMDEINDRLFKPRGLYALVMNYRPEQKRPVAVESLDLNTLVTKRQEQDSKTVKGALKMSAGTTYGAVELPTAAPLKYPELDQAITSGDAEKAAKLKIAGDFLGDYYDRRAQATYAAGDPNSALNLPESHKPHFASKFSDPNDPIHNGSLITLLSGGKLIPDQNKRRRKADRREARAQRRAERMGDEYHPPPHGATGGLLMNRKAERRGKRTMKRGVLYLMIVPLPTSQEISEAEAKVEAEARAAGIPQDVKVQTVSQGL